MVAEQKTRSTPDPAFRWPRYDQYLKVFARKGSRPFPALQRNVKPCVWLLGA